MGFRLTTSPMFFHDTRTDKSQPYSVTVYLNETVYFCRAFGATADIARLRAELICVAVNKLKPVDEIGLTRGLLEHVIED